jgi:hypothetical protein
MPATTASSPVGGATNVRVPATFTIGSGGSLTPTSVSGPAFVAVQVSIASGDGRAHHVVIATPVSRILNVPARGRALVLLAGQKAGNYALDVDGARRGMLIIGGEPGP